LGRLSWRIPLGILLLRALSCHLEGKNDSTPVNIA